MKHASVFGDRNPGPFVISLIAHAFVFAAFIYLAQRPHSFDPSLDSLQVRSVSEQELRAQIENAKDPQQELEKALSDDGKNVQQIVQADINLKSNRAPASTSEKIFLSGHNQVVDHNTRAARVGKFKNVLKEGVQSEAPAQSKPTASDLGIKNLLTLAPTLSDTEQERRLESKTGRLHQRATQSSRLPAAIPAPHEPAGNSGPKGDGLSATDDHLEDIAVGVNTLLNTKEFIFYSFYERIRVQLADAWHHRLGGELDKIYARGDNLGYDRKTKVQVLLDDRGQLQKILVLNGSGFSELDRAATDAFKVAAPFPNPPQGMIDPSKKQVSISWDFIVLADSGSAIKMEVRRSPAGF